MPVTKDEAQMLTTLALACRPHGAPRWDAAGIMAALGKVAHLSLADVMAAVARAASDRSAFTPAVIAATGSLHWREKVAERTTPTAPTREESCSTCGRHLTGCICGAMSARPSTRADRTARDTHLAAARAGLRGEAS